MIQMQTYKDVGIDVPNRTHGTMKVVCPKCPPHKNGNNKDKDLYIDFDHQSWKCFRCDFKGKLREKRPEKIKIEYKKPEWKNKTELSEKLVKYFESRAISQTTLQILKVTEGEEWFSKENPKANTIQFNYFRNKELINIKFRTAKKEFKMCANAELILYNLDSVENTTDLIIVEGEFDCLSYFEAGLQNVVSVPNGAGKDKNNLTYIDNCLDYFDNKEKIFIATDNDLAGRKLRDDLIQRLGAERCFLVDFNDCKDANEYLIKYGKLALRQTIENAKEVKVDGIFKVIDFENELDDLYINGLQEGLKIKHSNLDSLITWDFGTLSIITGIPGHGKSEAIDEIIVRLNLIHGLKAAYFSPENHPLKLHATKIISKVTGTQFKPEYLTPNDYLQAKLYLQDNFSFIAPTDENFSLDSILEKANLLIRKEGIKILVIDPWNRLEHQIKSGESETNYISKQLDKLTNFAQKRNVMVFLMAHPRKMNKQAGIYEVPNLYDINGSSNFFNKAFYGLTVYRIFDDLNPMVQIHVQKVKFKHLGQNGTANFKYNMDNGRFHPILENELPIIDNSNYLTDGIFEPMKF